MKLNPRHIPMREAENDLGMILIEWRKRNKAREITMVEELYMLNDAVATQLRLLKKSEHETAEKKAERKKAKGE
jgi:hypothetical protein